MIHNFALALAPKCWKWRIRISASTQDFHSCKRGSTPLCATRRWIEISSAFLLCVYIIKNPHTDSTVQWKNTGGLKQKHKKQPFGDASASHLSLVLWHV